MIFELGGKYMIAEVNQLSLADELINKFNSNNALIGVVGMGYVGLPLAIEQAKSGYRVIGFDINEERNNLINSGINHINDDEDYDLNQIIKNEQFYVTNNFSQIQQVDAIIICVPTPLNLYKQPDTSFLITATKEISKYIKRGALVVLESTTYPGTTEELIKPILEETDLICGQDFFLAYSPERIDPGNKLFNTKNIPKLIGGITNTCTEIAKTLYCSFLNSEIISVTSPAVAEMSKILENTFRNINIGLANEMAILCNKMGINVWEVIDSAATKPFGFMPFYPGPGLGGHCIPVDPWYLTWKAREYNYHTRLIEIAGEINDSMPDYIVQRCNDILNIHGKSIKGANIVLFGVAYKKDINDYRESPILPIIKNLINKGANLTIIDPCIKQFSIDGENYQTDICSMQDLQYKDLVVITTDHSKFEYDLIEKYSPLIFDTRNVISSSPNSGSIYRL